MCTAVCQSRVRVHEEAQAFGRIVNPACLKDLDCVAACPNGNLAYGFARPAVLELLKLVGRPARPYDLSLAEDFLVAAMFVAALFIFRGLYESIPFLMTLALGGILGYMAVLCVRLARRPHVQINNFHLKTTGRLTRAGGAFVAGAAVLVAFIVHSAFIRYHEFRGERLFAAVQAAAHASAPTDRATVEEAIRHLDFCRRWGLVRVPTQREHLALLYVALAEKLADAGDYPGAVGRLRAASRLHPDAAPVHYNLAVLLGALGRPGEAVDEYRRTLSLAPDDVEAHNNLGLLLAQRGEVAAAASHLQRAIALKPDFAHPHFNLGRLLMAQGRAAEAQSHFERAAALDPQYAPILSQSPSLRRAVSGP